MKMKLAFSMLAVTMAVLLAGVGIAGLQMKIEAAQPTPPQAPDGYVMVQEDVLYVLADAPGEHFHKARQSFLKKDFKTSAEEIRKSAAFLKLQAARATEEGKKGLDDSIAGLETLADDVEKGTVTSAKTLDQAFARAHQRLARHHYLKAAEYKAKKDTKRVGHELKAATLHLENGLAWSGHETEAGMAAVLRGTADLAGKLVKGTGGLTEDAGKGIDAVGGEIAKLGKAIEPGKSSVDK